MSTTSKLSSDIISILPLFYVGWSDSLLSPSELTIIRDKVKSMGHLSEDDKAYLLKWVDPLSPPTENEFKLWAHEIRRQAEGLDDEKRQSLITLGMEISKKQNQNGLANDSTHKALTELHALLGLNHSSEALLTKKLFPDLSRSAHAGQINTEEIKKLLDGKYGEVRDRVKQILTDPVFAYTDDWDKATFREKTKDRLIALSQQGISAYAFPKKYGGLEKYGEHIAAFETLGYGDQSLAIKFGVQVGLFGGAVFQLGTEKHHKLYVEPLMKGELLGCFAMTETGHGSNVKDLETTATYDHSTREIIVHSPRYASGKEYIGNALHSTMSAVFAQLIVDGENQGVHTVLVPLRNEKHELLPGIKVEDCGHKMGLNGVDNGRIWYNEVRVPVDNLLNRYGSINAQGEYESPIANPSRRFFTTLGALVAGRVCVGMLGLNASKVALTIALRYAYRRRQFGPKEGQDETPIIDYPTHQKRLFPQLAKTYAYYFASLDLADMYTNSDEETMREVETLAAGLKATSTWHATKTIQICREACGGKGYLHENRFTSLKADTDIFTTFEGDNTVLMQLVAKGALTNYKQSFHDDGYRAVMRFLLTKAKHEALEYNPLFTRNTDTSHLLDVKFHFHAFNYRYRKTLISLSERMRKYIKRGVNPHEAFLKVQNHMMDLAQAFVDQVTLNSFYKHVDNCQDPATKKVLHSLIQLYALDNIYEYRGWFLESDYMDGSKSKAIRRMITKLYQEIKPHALQLVDAFGIPDELVAAPIALEEWS